MRHAEEVSGNAALTCRYYGIIRQAFYQWRRRYETGGVRSPAGPVERQGEADMAQIVLTTASRLPVVAVEAVVPGK